MGKLRLRDTEVRAPRLPEMCMVCGQRSETEVKKSFSWYPPWVGVTILAGLIVYVILAVVLTKRMTVDVPLCNRHRGHFWKRTLLTWLTLIAWLATGGVAFALAAALAPRNDAGPAMGIVCALFGIGLIGVIIVIAVAQSTAIRPKEITDRDITLLRVHDDFIDAMQELCDQRRRRRDEEDFDYQERRPPRPRAVEDVDDRPRRRDSYRAERIDEDRPRRRRDDDD
jgi:hypothetical protein